MKRDDAQKNGHAERPAKRQRLSVCDVLASQQEQEKIKHILYVRWHGQQGQTKLSKLPLGHLEQLDGLKALPKELVDSHYPTSHHFPEYFTSPAYMRFTPDVECLSLPGDIVRTELRLAVCYQGWEYTVLRRDLSQIASGSNHMIHIMTAEFMGSDPLMAALGLRMSLIAYPIVALSKVFIEDVHERLLAAPEKFKGSL